MRDDYIRSVERIEVIDGDTFRCSVDLGFYVTVRMSCRLIGINAPEHNEPGGPEARAALTTILAAGPVTVRSVKADKYAGRFDALVTVQRAPGDAVLVQRWLIDRGFAVEWSGTGPKPPVPWPPPVMDPV